MRLHEGQCLPQVVPSKPRWKGDTLFEPETLRQARTFDTYKVRYVSVGLCHYCAAQAAYGHQHSFNVVEPVRDCCVIVVSQLPRAEYCCWRSMPVHDNAQVAKIRDLLTAHQTPAPPIPGSRQADAVPAGAAA